MSSYNSRISDYLEYNRIRDEYNNSVQPLLIYQQELLLRFSTPSIKIEFEDNFKLSNNEINEILKTNKPIPHIKNIEHYTGINSPSVKGLLEHLENEIEKITEVYNKIIKNKFGGIN